MGRPGLLDRIVQHFRIFLEAEDGDQLFARKAAIGLAFGEARKRAARTNHGIEQAARGDAFAKIQAIGNEARNAQMLRERAHDVVEALAHQNNFAARRHGFVQLGDAALFQPRLQKIFEEFLAEQVQAVAAHSAQHSVKKARGEDAVGDVEKRPREASVAMAPRRVQRCRKLCEFHAKKPTGRTAVRFSRLPSTRQKTGSRAGAEASRARPANFENLDV